MIRKTDMTTEDIRTLCVELQCRGVRIYGEKSGRSGGAGPAEGQTIVLGGSCITVPSTSWYVAHSPYHIGSFNGTWYLYKDGARILEVSFPPPPRFYTQMSSEGIMLQQIALLHGRDCFASTIYQDCKFWDTPLQCGFCGIGLSLKNSSTILRKKPADLGQAAAYAASHDGACHVTLTTGAWQDEPAGLAHLCACVREIKKQSGLPVHAQVHLPRAPNDLSLLKDAGVDTLGLHIEVCTGKLLAELAPGKAVLGIGAYLRCWRSAVSLFGKNQVSSFLIAGCGEIKNEFLSMVDNVAGLGVFPYVLPLRPIPHTPLADRTPPEPAYMEELYRETARILKKYGLASATAKAGCVRCGACSCLQLFEEELA